MTDTFDPRAAADAAERVCRLLAPEDLAERPLYVLAGSTIPPELAGGNAVTGWAAPYGDLLLKDAIGPRWRGRGWAIVVNDGHELVAEWSPQSRREWFTNVAMHELAHHMTWPPVLPTWTADDAPRLQTVVADRWREIAAQTPERPVYTPNTVNHPPEFARVCVHLICRAHALGLDLSHREVMSPGFRVCRWQVYREVIGDEPERWAGRKLSDLIDVPVSPELAEEWAGDAASGEAIW